MNTITGMLRFWFVQLALGAPVLLAGNPAPPVFLLPDDVTPQNYQIDLTIDPDRDTFKGVARIEMVLSKVQSRIWLNSKELNILSARIEATGRVQKVRAEQYGGEFVGLTSGTSLQPGSAVLLIQYRGRLHQKPVTGPYRIQFEKNWYVFTTFTPIEARRAFPCFDEPRFKTPWQLTIHVRREHKAFSNTPALSEVDEPGGMKAVRFAETAPLASEVVAFAVGPLDVLDGGTAGSAHVPVRVIAPRGHAVEGTEAARATPDVLARLEAYTGIPYPYAKVDHVALPQGAFGAVENPGLITYRMNGLLVSPAAATPQKLRAVRSVEAHELAHQWFGNLVTQMGWEDVWLSEGFATWLSQKVMGEDDPPSRRDIAATMARERIMLADAGPKTHPVRVAMGDRASMNTVYNQFVYQKGSAVLWMLENWLGEERFQTGLRSYLNQHRFKHATTADLAAALLQATGTDPTPVLSAFLDQPGVPEVRTEVHCDGGTTPRIEFEQTEKKSWAIPVCWKTDSLPSSCVLLDTVRKEVALPPNSACPAFVFANAAGSGYYRTVWDKTQLTALVNTGIGNLAPAERLTLSYDLRFLSKAGRLPSAAVEQATSRLGLDPVPEVKGR